MATAAAFLPAVLAIRSQVFFKPASQRMAVQAACCSTQRRSGAPVFEMWPSRLELPEA